MSYIVTISACIHCTYVIQQSSYSHQDAEPRLTPSFATILSFQTGPPQRSSLHAPRDSSASASFSGRQQHCYNRREGFTDSWKTCLSCPQ